MPIHYLIGSLLISSSINIAVFNPGDRLIESKYQIIDISDDNLEETRLIIKNKTLTLNQELQRELASEIAKAQNEIDRLSESLNRDIPKQIGLVYIHQGYENWSLRFTYSGYLLTTKQSILVDTRQVFRLKQIFSQTDSLQIADRKYPTTQYMNQLGGILHLK